MKKLRWQILIVVLALGGIVLLLIGQQRPTPPGITLQETVKPIQGGKYTEALIGSLGRLNPVLDWYNPADKDVDRLLYSSLIKFDDRSVPYGDLADSWAVSQDGKTYNFLLREAYWHDGQPVTSEDVAFTVEVLKNSSLPLPRDLMEFWKKVEVEPLDENVIQFRLPDSFAPFMDYLTFGIIPKHIWGDVPPEEMVNSELNLNPIGSGPYRFERFISDNGSVKGVELASFAQYYKKPPYIEKFFFRYFPDFTSGLQAIAASQSIPQVDDSGEIPERVQGISRIPNPDLPDAFKITGLNIFTGLEPNLGLLMFNLVDEKNPALQDQVVRQALLNGLNRQGIVDRVFNGQAVLANGPIFPASWAYYEGLPPVLYSPETAINDLKSAGYLIPPEGGDVRVKDGNRLEFDLIYPDSPTYASIAEAVKEDWSRIGVKINLTAVSPDTLIDKYLAPRNFQIALLDIDGTRYPDPDPYPFWHQSQAARGQNYSGWNDRQASEYLEQARTQVDPEERSRLYKNFQLRFMNQLPGIPLFFSVYSYGIGKDLKGIQIGPFYEPADRFNTVSNWFLSPAE